MGGNFSRNIRTFAHLYYKQEPLQKLKYLYASI